MKRTAILLQTAIVIFGLTAFAFMLWEPHLEGRNAHSTFFEIYFNDPFLAFAYIASIPFFIALYQGFKLSGLYGRKRIFSQSSIKALKTMRFCAILLLLFVATGEISILSSNSDDPAGGVFMGFIIATGSFLVAVAATKAEAYLKKSSA